MGVLVKYGYPPFGRSLAHQAKISREAGLDVTLRYADHESKKAQFKADLEAVFSSDTGKRMMINFKGQDFGLQLLNGHFSPIGAYHKDAQKVLILDVARYKYPSYWVDVDRIWDSMLTNDNMQKDFARGYLVVKPKKKE